MKTGWRFMAWRPSTAVRVNISHNDHRIAMMAAMAATACDGPVLLEDAGSVKKSYPDFWQVYAALGGRAEEV